MNIIEQIEESNRIEDIHRAVTSEEIKEHARFLRLERVTIPDLEQFVSVYQHGARLRLLPGLDVYVGNHIPPRGGEHIRDQLQALLDECNADKISPWEAHMQYEELHPFTDGNGRSGRMLWYWMMGPHPHAQLGFLHAFYYQSLQNARI